MATQNQRKNRITETEQSADTRGSACLTTSDVAMYLNVSESWLRQSRMTGNLQSGRHAPPFIRIGRCVRYLRSDLNDWLTRNRQILDVSGL